MGPREPNKDDFFSWTPFGDEMAYADEPPEDEFEDEPEDDAAESDEDGGENE